MHTIPNDASLHVCLAGRSARFAYVVPMPADTNHAGDIFGGWIMSQVDMAGSIPAIRRARGRIATVAVNSFVFKQPVFVGDLVSLYAEIIKVGTHLDYRRCDGIRAARRARRRRGGLHQSDRSRIDLRGSR
jgi:acyl-CoA thioesterase YciA